MGFCFPGSTSLLCSPVVCKHSLRYLVFVKFLYCIKKPVDAMHALEINSVDHFIKIFIAISVIK